MAKAKCIEKLLAFLSKSKYYTTMMMEERICRRRCTQKKCITTLGLSGLKCVINYGWLNTLGCYDIPFNIFCLIIFLVFHQHLICPNDKFLNYFKPEEQENCLGFDNCVLYKFSALRLIANFSALVTIFCCL